jgi:hypothetical protein
LPNEIEGAGRGECGERWDRARGNDGDFGDVGDVAPGGGVPWDDEAGEAVGLGQWAAIFFIGQDDLFIANLGTISPRATAAP